MGSSRQVINYGAAFNVSAGTERWRYITDELKESHISPIDTAKAHVTLVDPNEIVIEIKSEEDMVKMNMVRNVTRSFLSALCDGNTLVHTTNAQRLRQFPFDRKKVGIILPDEDEYLMRARADLLGIIEDHTNVTSIRDGKFMPHITLGKKDADFRRAMKESNKSLELPLVPPVLAITGYSIADRVLEVEDIEPTSTPDVPQKYINGPFHKIGGTV